MTKRTYTLRTQHTSESIFLAGARTTSEVFTTFKSRHFFYACNGSVRARARVVLSPSGSREITPREGHVVSSKRDETFVDILSKVSNPPALIGQTGLNAGHSAQILLDKFVSAVVVSFQLRGGRNTNLLRASPGNHIAACYRDTTY